MTDKNFPFSLFKILPNLVFVRVQPSLPSFLPFPLFIHPHLHDQLFYGHFSRLDLRCPVLSATCALGDHELYVDTCRVVMLFCFLRSIYICSTCRNVHMLFLSKCIYALSLHIAHLWLPSLAPARWPQRKTSVIISVPCFPSLFLE